MDLIVTCLVLLGLTSALIGHLQRPPYALDGPKMWWLFAFHLLMSGVYYYYVQFNASDSYAYFDHANSQALASLFGTGTPFPSFLAWPLVQIGLSYTSVMLVFAWLGFIGFLAAYALFSEVARPISVPFFSTDLLTVILFLPNMHFWTGSLGKGSIAFAGTMLFFLGVLRPQQRLGFILLGGFLTYMVRPHVFLFMLVGLVFGLLLDNRSYSVLFRGFVITAAAIGAFFATGPLVQKFGLEEAQSLEQMMDEFADKAQTQADRLSSSGSGIDINSYPVPLKLLTFWFRPLFIDSPNFMGHFASMENLLYVGIFAMACNWGFIRFLNESSYLFKASVVIFFATSFALTLVMSNLGIILRQKSMVMYFGFLPIYCYLAEQQWQRWLEWRRSNGDVDSEYQADPQPAYPPTFG